MMQRRQHKQNLSCNDSGFTIVESLIGLIVAAVLLAAIAPILVLSTANRVQARRVEKAAKAARTFIDGVRAKAIAAPTKTITLSALPASNQSRSLSENLVDTTKMPIPQSASDTSLYCFKKDGTITTNTTGCNTDKFEQFFIQAAQIKVTGSGLDDGYRLAIRVYRTDINFSQTITASNSNIKKTQRTFTPGLGDRQAPIIEMTTDIANSDTTFNALCQRLGPAPNKICQ